MSDMDNSCGMVYLHNLSNTANGKEQAGRILSALREDGSNHKGTRQAIFTDTVNSRAWAAAKAVAYKGPITVNPGTGNRIQTYIVTEAEVLDIFNS